MAAYVKVVGTSWVRFIFCIEELLFGLVRGVPLDSEPNTPHRKEFMQVDLQM